MPLLRLALLAVLTTGCSGPNAVATAPSGPPVRDLRIGLLEYDVELSASAVLPGRVTVVVTNAGSAPHDVRLRQGGRTLGRSRVLAPGQQQRLVLQVASARQIALDCTLAGHAQAGMRAQLAVAQSSVP